MPYQKRNETKGSRRSPSKYRYLPQWMRRQQQDIVDREYDNQRGVPHTPASNWGVPRGREL